MHACCHKYCQIESTAFRIKATDASKLQDEYEKLVEGYPTALRLYIVVHVIVFGSTECVNGLLRDRAGRVHPSAHFLSIPDQPLGEPLVRRLGCWIDRILLLRKGREVENEIEDTNVVEDIRASSILAWNPVHVDIHVREVVFESLYPILVENFQASRKCQIERLLELNLKLSVIRLIAIVNKLLYYWCVNHDHCECESS